MTALAVWQARRRPYLIVGWLWFLGMLVPVIGLVQAHVQALADRFAYVPAIGVFVMVVWAAAEWIARLAARSPGNHRSTQIDTDKNCVGSPRPPRREALHRTVAQGKAKQDRSPALGICVHLCSSVVFPCLVTAWRPWSSPGAW